jgi:hypothetical protein
VFLRKAALRPVPSHAVVGDQAVEAVEETLGDAQDALQDALDRGYADLDRKQPALATWLADEVSGRHDELVQSLGYFLAVTVYLAFAEAFPRRLREVDDGGLQMALDTLAADEELRANDPSEILDSDDVVAMGQPALLAFVQHHLDQALEQAGTELDLADLDRVYRAVLVEVIALSHAVESPSGRVGPEALA